MNKLQRKRAYRSYKPVVYILPECETTEESYFRALSRFISSKNLPFSISCKSARHGSIASLLKLAKSIEKDCHARDQIWILVDRDEEDKFREQFARLEQWQNQKPNLRHVALSVPRFEYWLLLHFEDKPSGRDAENDKSLVRYFPNYLKRKSVENSTAITESRVLDAIARANSRFIPTCSNLDGVGTGVGLLVGMLMGKRNFPL